MPPPPPPAPNIRTFGLHPDVVPSTEKSPYDLSSAIPSTKSKVVTVIEEHVPVTSTSNACDLPSQVRGQAIPVPSLSTLSETSVNQIKSKLSPSAEPFNMPSLPESCDTEKSQYLSIFDGRFSDLRGKFKLFTFEECIPPPQTGPSFSTCKSLIPISSLTVVNARIAS